MGKEESGYEDEDASAVSSPQETSEEEVDSDDGYNSDSEQEAPQKKRGRKPGQKPKSNGKTLSSANSNNDNQKGQELWRPGVKVSSEGAVFIPLPKARSAGSTPYKDTTIHPNTLAFLSDLRANNDREWLKVHDADYRQSKSDWDNFVSSLTEKIIEKDETIPELPPKDLTFRIYRDIRFSPDPTPYKTHFSAAWSRTGRKGPYAGYYVQVQPGGSFVGAGVWHPEAAPLALLRRDVDRRSERLKGVLKGEKLKAEFLGVKESKGKKGKVGGEEAECVRRFVEINQENALKTKPRVNHAFPSRRLLHKEIWIQSVY